MGVTGLGRSPSVMTSSSVRRDRNASDFASITPLELVLLFTGGWCADGREAGRNGSQELTRENQR